MKRILAWIGIILLVLLYLTTLIASLINSPFSRSLFYASVAMTIILPVLLYGWLYLRQVVLSGVWPDFYGFNKNGKWRLSFSLMILGTVAAAVLLWAL